MSSGWTSRRARVGRVFIAAAIGLIATGHAFDAQREDPPPSAPRGFTRADVRPEPVVIHGPFDLTATDLSRLAKKKAAPKEMKEDRTVNVFDPAIEPECPSIGCIDRWLPDDLLLRKTPRPTTQIDTGITGGTGFDLQVAASDAYLVVAGSRTIYFMDKAGALLENDGGSSVYTSKVLFKPLLDDANLTLNLPPGLPSGVPDVDSNYLLDTVFDVHVLFDEYRRRFWIAALAINNDTDIAAPFSPIALAARRNKFFAAVSKTQDPRDGFFLYWWDAVIGDGTCNTQGGCGGTFKSVMPLTNAVIDLPILPGDKVDYPSIGISQHFFLATSTLYNSPPDQQEQNNKNNRYYPIWRMPAAAMAGGQCALQCVGYVQAIGDKRKIAQPAVHHGPAPSALSFIAERVADGDAQYIVLWAFDNSPQAAVWSAAVPIETPRKPAYALQRPTFPEIPHPRRLGFRIGSPAPMKAAFRGQRFYTTLQDCVGWENEEPCVAAIRVIGIDVVQQTLVMEQSFGLRNMFDDGPADRVAYLWPSLEVNQDDTVVVGYVRSATPLYPEARYSAWFSGDGSISASQVLRKGEYTLGANDPAPKDDPAFDLDFTGITVDPFDDTSVWMALAFGFRTKADPESGRWQLTVGKVFGQKVSDLAFAELELANPPAQSIQELKPTVRIRNQGDGDAPATTLELRVSADPLLSSNDPIIATCPVPALASGQDTPLFTVPVSASGALPGGAYYVFALLDVGHVAQEYSEDNNREVVIGRALARKKNK